MKHINYYVEKKFMKIITPLFLHISVLQGIPFLCLQEKGETATVNMSSKVPKEKGKHCKKFTN